MACHLPNEIHTQKGTAPQSLFSSGAREMNTIWFKQANLWKYCVKMLVNTSVFTALFPCILQKFALFKLSDPVCRKMMIFLFSADEARLTPCKDNDTKRLWFFNHRAYRVRLPCAYIAIAVKIFGVIHVRRTKAEHAAVFFCTSFSILIHSASSFLSVVFGLSSP